MTLRIIEIYSRTVKTEDIEFLMKDIPVLDMWHDHLPEGEIITKILLKSEQIDSVLDIIDDFYSRTGSFRVVILPVEATVPRPEEPPKEEEKEQSDKEATKPSDRISIEELYQKMYCVVGVSNKYVIMTLIASFVAAVGLLNNDVAIIIGSMVIAPLLSPYMGFSLATTLADFKLARKSVPCIIIGSLLALVTGTVVGLFTDVDPAIPEIASRSNVSHYYIFLALAAGVAGAYSITTGIAEALVGVMVAVALLPPLVASGLLLGGFHWLDAIGALLLFCVNVASVNLSGVVTFALEGIRPVKWWEAEKAKKGIRISIFTWIVFLILLVFLIYIEQQLKMMT